jgi:isopenicillin-N N-acyltransferase like protein
MTLISRRELLGGGVALLGCTLPRGARAAPKLPFPELTAHGSFGALGLAHGRAFITRISANLAFYLQWLSKETGASKSRLLELARSFAPVLAKHTPAQLEEIDGIAKGSRRSRDEILLLNARSDLLVLGMRKPRAAAPASPASECTSLALFGPVPGTPLLALGQNWDWQPEVASNTVVLRLHPAKAPRLVTFTEAGMVAKIGFNEHRLGVCLNFLGHTSDDPNGAAGVPVHGLLRAVLTCATLEEAYKLVAWAPRCASANLLLAQHRAGGAVSALDLELTPNAIARVARGPAGIVHANHFKNAALAPGCTGRGSVSTRNRDRVATELALKLQHAVPDPVSRMKQVLASRSGAPLSVSKSATPQSPSETLAGIIMDLGRNQLLLAAGSPHRAAWVVRPGV